MRKFVWRSKAMLLYGLIRSMLINASDAQPPAHWEFGVSTGMMNCLTDVGGGSGKEWSLFRDLQLRSSRPCAGLLLSYRWRSWLGIRFDLQAGAVGASDQAVGRRDRNLAGRYGRNLDFRSPVYELLWGLEIRPLEWFNSLRSREEPRDRSSAGLQPLLLFGFGMFHFDPQAVLDGHRVRLHPLRLEGQGFAEYPGVKQYKLTQVNIPFGGGLSYASERGAVLRLECVYRFLFTDHLDDVSGAYIDRQLFGKYLDAQQAVMAGRLHDRSGELGGVPGGMASSRAGQPRGNPSNRDGYLGMNLRVGFTF